MNPISIVSVLLVGGFLAFLAVRVYSTLGGRFGRPPVKLREQFAELRKLILKGVDDVRWGEADKLLDKCEEHLETLITAQKKLQILAKMEEDMSALVDSRIAVNRETGEKRIKKDIAGFLQELAKISQVTDFDSDLSVQQLSEFTLDLQVEREVLLDLAQANEPMEIKF